MLQSVAAAGQNINDLALAEFLVGTGDGFGCARRCHGRGVEVWLMANAGGEARFSSMTATRRFHPFVASAFLLVACSTGGGAAGDGGSDVHDAGAEAAADVAPACTGGSSTGGVVSPSTRYVTVNGVERAYVLDVPQSAIDAMAQGCGGALVIGLHGAGDTADNFLYATGLEETALARGFVLAGPQALGGLWVLQPPAWTSPDGQPTSLWNDIALVRQMVADVEGEYRIDPARVFVTGLSRGGYFAGLLATASNNPEATGGPYSSPFAAYAVCAGADAYGGAVDFSQSSPKNPIWIIHGTADAQVPFADGQLFADELLGAGWPVTFTPVQDAPHNWLWQPRYGYSNDDLWSWFAAHPAPP
jgi:poly(3-hydroxybutyrate) depolymerase